MKLLHIIWNYINDSMIISTILLLIFAYIICKNYIAATTNLKTKTEERKEKIKNMKMTNARIENSNGVTLSMPDRIDLTNSILDLITFMITNEIMSYMKTFMALNIKYEVSNLDDDIKKISQTVFHGINPSLFADPNLILTPEYLMSYITKKTTNVFLETTIQYNQSLRSTNLGTGGEN